MTGPPSTWDDRDDPLLSYAEVAELLGISVAAVRNYRWKGLMPTEDLIKGNPKQPIRLWRRSRIVAWNTERLGRGNWAPEVPRPVPVTLRPRGGRRRPPAADLAKAG